MPPPRQDANVTRDCIFYKILRYCGSKAVGSLEKFLCKTKVSDGTATFALVPWGEGVQRTGGNILPLYRGEREKILNERSEFSILGEGFIRGREEPRGQANISNEDLNTPTITNLNVSILPSCPLNFGFSDCYPPLPSLIREGANLSKSDVQNYKGDTSRPFDTSCVHGASGAYNGYGCTAWVIYNENMDYLHCNGLGWDKKVRCR